MAKWVKNPTSADKAKWAEERKRKLADAKTLLQDGVKAAYEKENFRKCLEFYSGFHDYSFCNMLLILAQKPEATYCASYKDWTKKGRHVKKGEHGLMIRVPTPKKTEVKNENGDVVEVKTEMRYSTGSVFDISQTDGAEVPEICGTLKGKVDGYEEMFDHIRRVCPVPIEFEEFPGEAYGYFSDKERKVVIRKGIPEQHTVKTAIHETAHAMLHGKGGKEEKADRQTRELQAESVAFIVCHYYGIDTAEYSFDYVASWARDKSGKALERNLNLIGETAKEIINKMEVE